VAYSKVTKKGQITIPAHVREQHGFGEGIIVAFKEGREGLIIEPVRDITESAGKLSRFARADKVIRDLLRSREQEFR
jgi:AbrB family looped-hinge helix DNA binding protein